MTLKKCFALCAVLAIACAGVMAQQQREVSGTQGGDPAMEAWMKAATPGEHHKHLGKSVGSWTYEGQVWMAPGAEAAPMSGTMDAKLILGGRWVQTEVKGSMMGLPTEGVALDGYDNVTGRYVSSWRDTMNTAVRTMYGKCDGTGTKTTYKGSMADPRSGQEVTVKQTVTWIDDNTIKAEMWVVVDGKDFKNMEFTAKRK